MEIIEINLDLPPQERWHIAANYTQEINALITCYWKDIEDYIEFINEYLESFKQLFVPDEYWQEIQGLARFSTYSADQILIANLYYDIVKFAFACTAFAFEKDGVIWHARNLDWWTDNAALEKYTKLFSYTRAGKVIFQSVGWMGFIGVLSGMKPNAFSVTLNAIVSEEAPAIAKPISFFIREVLEGDYDYSTAKTLLSSTDIICDCLLLLVGTQTEEMVVIERTPTTATIREPSKNYIIVTNDYKKRADSGKNHSILKDTSCGRYDQTVHLLEESLPSDAKGCFSILNDPAVKMQITVQQMVFSAQQGYIKVL